MTCRRPNGRLCKTLTGHFAQHDGCLGNGNQHRSATNVRGEVYACVLLLREIIKHTAHCQSRLATENAYTHTRGRPFGWTRRWLVHNYTECTENGWWPTVIFSSVVSVVIFLPWKDRLLKCIRYLPSPQPQWSRHGMTFSASVIQWMKNHLTRFQDCIYYWLEALRD